jgi:hypothetical protein
MSELTLNPGVVAPQADRPLSVPALPVVELDVRRRAEARARRRFTAVRPLHTNDGGFRPFRVY